MNVIKLNLPWIEPAAPCHRRLQLPPCGSKGTKVYTIGTATRASLRSEQGVPWTRRLPTRAQCIYYPKVSSPTRRRAALGTLIASSALLSLSAPAHAKGRHKHDGTYVRASIGVGDLTAKREVEVDAGYERAAMAPESQISPTSTMFQLAVGTTPVKQLVLGGNILGLVSRTPVAIDHPAYYTEVYERAYLWFGGLMVDYYLDEEGGWHIGGTLGLASLTIPTGDPSGDPSIFDSFGGVGGGFCAHFGYDIWIADQLSLGLQLHYLDARLSGSHSANGVDAEEKDVVRAVGGTIGVLFH